MSKAFVTSGAWAALDNLSAAALAFLFFVMTARLLTPAEFGIAALALSVAQMIQPFVDSLFHDAVVQKADLCRADLTTAGSFCALWGVVLALALWILAPSIARLVSTPALAAYLPWMGLAFVLSGLSAVASAKARRDLQFRMLAIRTVVARTLGLGFGIAMAWMGYGVWSVVVQFIIAATLSTLLLLISVEPYLGRISWYRLKPLLAFAAPTVGTQFLFFANSRIATLIIGSVLGPVAAGTWTVALRFVEPLQSLLATTIGQLALPMLSRYQLDCAKVTQYYMLGTRYMAMLLAPTFLGLAICARPVIIVLVGSKWLDAVPIMQVICIVTMLLLVRQMSEIALTSCGRPSYTFITHILGSGLSLAGKLIGVPFGLLAAVTGWSARVLPFLLVNAIFIKREFGISGREQFRGPVPSFVAGLSMCGVLYGVDRALGAVSPPLVTLTSMIAIGAATYGIVLFAVDGAFRQALTLHVLQRIRSVRHKNA